MRSAMAVKPRTSTNIIERVASTPPGGANSISNRTQVGVLAGRPYLDEAEGDAKRACERHVTLFASPKGREPTPYAPRAGVPACYLAQRINGPQQRVNAQVRSISQTRWFTWAASSRSPIRTKYRTAQILVNRSGMGRCAWLAEIIPTSHRREKLKARGQCP